GGTTTLPSSGRPRCGRKSPAEKTKRREGDLRAQRARDHAFHGGAAEATPRRLTRAPGDPRGRGARELLAGGHPLRGVAPTGSGAGISAQVGAVAHGRGKRHL